jgi:hypothetical protein
MSRSSIVMPGNNERSDLNPDRSNRGILKHREDLLGRLRARTSMKENRGKDKREDRAAKRLLTA